MLISTPLSINSGSIRPYTIRPPYSVSGFCVRCTAGYPGRVPNRGRGLDWDGASGPRPGPGRQSHRARPAGLSIRAIVEAAIAVADADGLDAVSIRRVAAELDVRPMSLYTHIASKADLLALMANELTGLMLAEEPLPADWRAALSEITRRYHAAWVSHPWGLEVFARRPRLGPNATQYAKQLAETVAGLDLEPGEVWTLLGIVNDYAIGHALRTANSASTQDLDQALSPDDLTEFPELSALPGVIRARGSSERFEIGLQAVLDGVEGRFLTRRAARLRLPE